MLDGGLVGKTMREGVEKEKKPKIKKWQGIKQMTTFGFGRNKQMTGKLRGGGSG